MSIIYVLIPIAILFVCIGLGIFFWAVRSRQGMSILFEENNKAVKPEADPDKQPPQ